MRDRSRSILEEDVREEVAAGEKKEEEGEGVGGGHRVREQEQEQE